MSAELCELYHEMIIDHNNYPRNHYSLIEATSIAHGFNRLCGDKLTIYLKVKDDILQDISFIGNGCAISQASASLMTEAVKGKPLAEVLEFFNNFHNMLTNNNFAQHANSNAKLNIFAGVRSYPARVKCATLAWHTLKAALKQESKVISTE